MGDKINADGVTMVMHPNIAGWIAEGCDIGGENFWVHVVQTKSGKYWQAEAYVHGSTPRSLTCVVSRETESEAVIAAICYLRAEVTLMLRRINGEVS